MVLVNNIWFLSVIVAFSAPPDGLLYLYTGYIHISKCDLIRGRKNNSRMARDPPKRRKSPTDVRFPSSSPIREIRHRTLSQTLFYGWHTQVDAQMDFTSYEHTSSWLGWHVRAEESQLLNTLSGIQLCIYTVVSVYINFRNLTHKLRLDNQRCSTSGFLILKIIFFPKNPKNSNLYPIWS